MSDDAEEVYVSDTWSPDFQWTVIGAKLTPNGVIAPPDNKRKWFINHDYALREAREIASRVASKGGEIELIVVKAAFWVKDSLYSTPDERPV